MCNFVAKLYPGCTPTVQNWVGVNPGLKSITQAWLSFSVPLRNWEEAEVEPDCSRGEVKINTIVPVCVYMYFNTSEKELLMAQQSPGACPSVIFILLQLQPPSPQTPRSILGLAAIIPWNPIGFLGCII